MSELDSLSHENIGEKKSPKSHIPTWTSSELLQPPLGTKEYLCMKALKQSLTFLSLLKDLISLSQVLSQLHGTAEQWMPYYQSSWMTPVGSSRAMNGTVIQNHAQERIRHPCYRSTSHWPEEKEVLHYNYKSELLHKVFWSHLDVPPPSTSQALPHLPEEHISGHTAAPSAAGNFQPQAYFGFVFEGAQDRCLPAHTTHFCFFTTIKSLALSVPWSMEQMHISPSHTTHFGWAPTLAGDPGPSFMLHTWQSPARSCQTSDHMTCLTSACSPGTFTSVWYIASCS